MANGDSTGSKPDYQAHINNLSDFKVSRVLSDYSDKKSICVLGAFGDCPDQAILRLEKSPFNTESVSELCTDKSKLSTEFVNDIYGSYSCEVDPKLNVIKTNLIYPATDAHVAKFEYKPTYFIEETPEIYNSITLPFLLREQFDLQWLYNILDHKKETERIVFEDPDPKTGFILLPDFKWNGKQIDDLYLLAIVRTTEIKSLRDLNDSHLPLLRNIRDKGLAVIENKYKVPKSQIRAYIHYQPSYYHLHVHFTYLKFEAPGIYVGKAHLLSTVINNIELYGNYYQKATLSFILSEAQKLFIEYQSKGIPGLEALKKEVDGKDEKPMSS